jgi:3-deoxy-manno-octulosonate cytidylyltransferase (CMP-KDO synthetase)|tara:strand:- start:98 stop:817 length:720 start_codon:yes stop_codon:yes gene_type:complete
MKTLILIPARMASTRLPNKPLAIIAGKPMIQRVWEQAKLSNIGDVVVACSEKEVFDLIKSIGGNAILTNPNIPSGTDRIFQATVSIENMDQYESIINLQGDLPLINPKDIKKVNIPIEQGFDIGTLVTDLTSEQQKDINVTKVKVKWIKKNIIGEAFDFYKTIVDEKKNEYHHVGIYSFRYESLKKFTSMLPSKNEIYHKLEQWRALDNKMTIGTSYVKDVPISVDTKEDLIKVENIIK